MTSLIFALVTLFVPALATDDVAPRARLAPTDIAERVASGPGAGSSGVKGIETIVLKGDPTKPGLYTILLRVPAHTTIQAHSHPDDRIATVVEGDWHFGYGKHFDAAVLRTLPPGSFYTEPPHEAHFAQTDDTAVSVQITGYGPTATDYENPSDAPKH